MTDARTQGCSQVLRGPVLTPRTFPGALVQAAPQDCCPNFHPPLPVFQVVEGDFDSFDTIAILTLHRYWLFQNHPIEMLWNLRQANCSRIACAEFW